MQNYQADLELTLLHIQQVEQRIADQQARIAHLRKIGGQTDIAEDLLRTLQTTQLLLRDLLARITGPIPPDKASI